MNKKFNFIIAKIFNALDIKSKQLVPNDPIIYYDTLENAHNMLENIKKIKKDKQYKIYKICLDAIE